MAKKRIHQLAKELDVASADILFKAKELGIQVKTASSGLTEDEEELVKLSYKEDSILEETETEVEEVKEIEEVSNEKNEDTKDINIVEVTEGSTPEDLSIIIEKDSTEIVSDLMSLGIMQSITSSLSNEEIEKLLETYNIIPEFNEKIEIKRSDLVEEIQFEDKNEQLKTRSPIITVMGHVDPVSYTHLTLPTKRIV